MINDKWVIRWREFLSVSYAYGTKVEFFGDGKVKYKNELLPPGTVIHTWYSKTNFQSMRIEPMLPLIDGESAYSLNANVEYTADMHAGILMRIVYLDRYDKEFDSVIIRGGRGYFKPPIKTYSFRIELISGGCTEFLFESLVLQEVSEEEFDAECNRIEKNKKYRKKDKKSRRKVQSAE